MTKTLQSIITTLSVFFISNNVVAQVCSTDIYTIKQYVTTVHEAPREVPQEFNKTVLEFFNKK